MSVLVGIVALCVAVLVSFSDKIIEHFLPNGRLAKMEKETDEVISHIEEEDYLHIA
jgi:hypothetical protein